MKYSESPDYIEYGRCIANDDIIGAKIQIEKCLKISELTKNPDRHSGLLVTLGDLYLKLKDRMSALDKYKEAVSINGQSFFTKYLYAKFLFENLSEISESLEICERIIEFFKKNDLPETNEDFGSRKYIKMAEELKNNIINTDPCEQSSLIK